MITRSLTATSLAGDSCFLWGPRQTGKSTLLRTLFPTLPPTTCSPHGSFGGCRLIPACSLRSVRL